MNAAPMAAPAAASAPRGTSARSESGVAESGFAALFAQLEPSASQAEPTALPTPAAQPIEQVETPATEGPDPALLAALGLAPLPPVLPGGALGLGLGYGGAAVQAQAGAALTAGAGLGAGPLAPLPGQGAVAAPYERLATAQVGTEIPADTLLRHPRAGGDPAAVLPPSTFSATTADTGPRLSPAAIAAQLARAPAVTAVDGNLAAAATGGAADSADASAATAAQTLAGTLAASADALAAAETATTAAPRPGANFSAAANPQTPGLTPPSAGATTALPAGDAGIDLAGLSLRADASEDALSTRTSPRSMPTSVLQAALGMERAELAASLRESLAPTLPVLPTARLEPGSPQFSATLGQQVVWMASQQVGRAELKLSPDELGPLEISLEMNGDEIRAEFASRSAEVRSLLETQVPRLRELLAEQGFNLADAQVGQERAAYQDAPQQREGFAQRDAAMGGSEEGSAAEAPAAVAIRRHNGLIDDFA
jgi:flagellar hook-length control protein FliK